MKNTVAAYYIRRLRNIYCKTNLREADYKKTKTKQACLEHPNLNISISTLEQNAKDDRGSIYKCYT